MMYFIEDSVTHETVTDAEIAYEGGKLFGEFLTLTSDFDASTLCEVIPKFHDMSFRFSQFEDALKVASQERLTQAADLLEKVAELKEEMHILQRLKKMGKFHYVLLITIPKYPMPCSIQTTKGFVLLIPIP